MDRKILSLLSSSESFLEMIKTTYIDKSKQTIPNKTLFGSLLQHVIRIHLEILKLINTPVTPILALEESLASMDSLVLKFMSKSTMTEEPVFSTQTTQVDLRNPAEDLILKVNAFSKLSSTLNEFSKHTIIAVRNSGSYAAYQHDTGLSVVEDFEEVYSKKPENCKGNKFEQKSIFSKFSFLIKVFNNPCRSGEEDDILYPSRSLNSTYLENFTQNLKF